ncbi:AP2 domain-containing protein [Zhongshania sp.]|jgi:hypothetical protein|uniref:AP2 domain-containing protein n=1 Tax=Zhongshania sp. TaxID=1971902 RepID=UPI001B61667E|nr:AP2 domain-containing protein [Zhongshania sp.]MBQ0794966.1 hypothetical protein [Zhongshania sp.]|tara:strand:+ start:1074 stop:1565 length:492 start_codon:yes stop_codon:yes gene_type:complete
MPKSKAMYGITRIDDDYHRTHAWRVSLRRQNKMHVKNFPDKTFKGKRKALAAAKVFRDEIIDKYPPTTRQAMCNIQRSNNKSGITGVYSYAKRYKLKNNCIKELWYWEAHWPGEKPGTFGKATFSFQQYGEKKAHKLAIAARKAGVAKLKGVFWASERGEKSQ